MANKKEKQNSFFQVVYVSHCLEDADDVFVAPNTYIQNGLLSMKQLPMDQEDKESWDSILKKHPNNTPDVPPTWVKYPVVVLSSYSTLKGAKNRWEVLKNDYSLLQNNLYSALQKINKLKLSTTTASKSLDKTFQAQLNAELNNVPIVQQLPDNSNNNESVTSVNISVQDSEQNVIIENGGEIASDVMEEALSNEPIVLTMPEENNLHDLNNYNDTGYSSQNVSMVQHDYAGSTNIDVTSEIIEIKYTIMMLSSKVDSLEAAANSQTNEIKELRTKCTKVEKSCEKLMALIQEKSRQDKISQSEILVAVNEVQTFVTNGRPLRENDDIVTRAKLIATHNLNLPLKKKKKFITFEEKLKNPDLTLASDLKKHIISTVSTELDVQSTVTNIIKDFFKRAVLLKCVAQKETPGKLVFKNTTFFSILQEALSNVDPSKFKEKVVLRVIGTIIANSKDWEGGRLEREKAKLAKMQVQLQNNEEQQRTSKNDDGNAEVDN